MITFPYAKINVGLNIINKRSDNYHNIESVLVPIPLYDILEITPSNSFKFKTHGIKIPGKQEENLIVKALELLRTEFSFPEVEINLVKKIPSGAGLGGGSSNAAHTIKLINSIFELGLSTKAMKSFALKIGSDCPFFIENKMQYVTGRGEIMEPLNFNPISGNWLLLITPDLHISTAKAYSLIHPEEKKIPLKELINSPVKEWQQNIQNDFQNPIFTQYPELNTLYKEVFSEAIFRSMTGTGSAMYGIFKEKMELDIPVKHHWLKLA